MTYSKPSKSFPKHSYFCDWYYRCQFGIQMLAIIQSAHKTKDSAFALYSRLLTPMHFTHNSLATIFKRMMSKSVSVTIGLESPVSRWIS